MYENRCNYIKEIYAPITGQHEITHTSPASADDDPSDAWPNTLGRQCEDDSLIRVSNPDEVLCWHTPRLHP